MDFETYQTATSKTDIRDDRSDVVLPMLGLVGEVGSLVAEYKKQLRAGGDYADFVGEVREDLGDLLWYAATLAQTMNLSLEDIALANLEKTRLAWIKELPPSRAYDAGFPEAERLPRSFAIRFAERFADGIIRVEMYEGDTTVGDPLDDNSIEEDFFRYHDAIHLAHAAILGWSPTFRSLLDRKRRSNADVDRVQDGARAIFLEEGLVAYVFSVARSVGFFEHAQRVDWDLLKTIGKMTAHLEVGDRSMSEWQDTLLQGFEVWRQLRDNKGGLVVGDLDRRTLSWMP